MTRTEFVSRLSLAAVLVTAASLPAAAHTGVGIVHDLTHGLMHPFTGLDHVLAMVAVGVIAAQIGGPAIWRVPASFLAMMALGGGLAMTGAGLPFVELGIAASVIVLGAAVALRLPLPGVAAMALGGVFALFHGYAHGSEIPLDASAASYAGGFLLATALLHLAGLALGFGIGRIGGVARTQAFQAGGAATSLAGIGLLVGWL